jgi:hypothetical protein
VAPPLLLPLFDDDADVEDDEDDEGEGDPLEDSAAAGLSANALVKDEDDAGVTEGVS